MGIFYKGYKIKKFRVFFILKHVFVSLLWTTSCLLTIERKIPSGKTGKIYLKDDRLVGRFLLHLATVDFLTSP